MCPRAELCVEAVSAWQAGAAMGGEVTESFFPAMELYTGSLRDLSCLGFYCLTVSRSRGPPWSQEAGLGISYLLAEPERDGPLTSLGEGLQQ